MSMQLLFETFFAQNNFQLFEATVLRDSPYIYIILYIPAYNILLYLLSTLLLLLLLHIYA